MSRRRGPRRPNATYITYKRFKRLTVRSTNRQVAETDAEQAQARVLVAAGFAAYENRAGLIRDVAEPRRPYAAGRVFAVRDVAREMAESGHASEGAKT